jgi:oligopeptide/dipeptide ABC transporter ATP-binding protein
VIGPAEASSTADLTAEPLLAVRDLVVHHSARRRLLQRAPSVVHAVCGVSFDLHPGETLAVVGESGCGKTTMARAIVNLQPATSGHVRYAGEDLTTIDRRGMRRHRRDMQIVFQDPLASLDPRMTARDAVSEPLRIHREYAGSGRDRVDQLLLEVGIEPRDAGKYPHEFSGGQRQRIAIARALALHPRVLVLDEPVSALDVSVQAGVVNLLEDLQRDIGMSYVFVSHDLSVVRHVAHRVAVMYLGQIVEIAGCDDLFEAPTHPYTQALISAIPLPDPRRERERDRIIISGDVPSPLDPPSGCRFRTRCPKFQELTVDQRELCVREAPQLEPRGNGHLSACHFADVLSVV